MKEETNPKKELKPDLSKKHISDQDFEGIDKLNAISDFGKTTPPPPKPTISSKSKGSDFNK